MQDFVQWYRDLISAHLRFAYADAISGDKISKTCSAFHMQQAIEKTFILKAHLCGLRLCGHNLGRLIKKCDRCGVDINIPSLFRKNAYMYTSWEMCYRRMIVPVVNRNSILAAHRVCLEWLNSGNTKI